MRFLMVSENLQVILLQSINLNRVKGLLTFEYWRSGNFSHHLGIETRIFRNANKL